MCGVSSSVVLFTMSSQSEASGSTSASAMQCHASAMDIIDVTLC